MNWKKWADRLFPYIEPLTDQEKADRATSLRADVATIAAARFGTDEQGALDQSQRVAAAEMERVRVSESKATTYLAVLAAFVPLVITLQAATWENKSGPAPAWLKLGVLAAAVVYVAAAGYHAFRTLRVSGFQRIGEVEVASAWRSPRPLQKLARSTLLASRRSRDAVNLKVTYIKVTHEHLLRAFGAFVLLLLLDPVFYAIGFHNENAKESLRQIEIEVSTNADQIESDAPVPEPTTTPGDPETLPARQQDRAALPSPSPAPASDGALPATGDQSEQPIQPPAD